MTPTANGPRSMATSLPPLSRNSPTAVAAAVAPPARYPTQPLKAVRHRKNSANEHHAKLGAAITSTAQRATRTNIHTAHGRRRWDSTAITA
ncbi:hypothetical protein D9M72_522430 [compost metagenome]